MTTIYRDNASRLSVADAKRLILDALPPETSGEVYAQIDENGEVNFEGPVEVKVVHGVQIYASFIDRDFLSTCKQLSIRPRMKYRPVLTDYIGDISQDDTYTIAHDEFVSLAELFNLLVVTGIAPEPQASKPSPAPTVGSASNAPARARRDLLAPVIEAAQKECGDQFDAPAVWAPLVRMASAGKHPLLGVSDDGIKWQDSNDKTQFLTIKNLRDRLSRSKKKAR